MANSQCNSISSVVEAVFCASREWYLQKRFVKFETIFFALFANQTLWDETEVRENFCS